jgi:hypothetical protein
MNFTFEDHFEIGGEDLLASVPPATKADVERICDEWEGTTKPGNGGASESPNG